MHNEFLAAAVQVPLSRIKPYEQNPRKNENSVEKVANSIREFGFLQPIVCDADGVILAGHTRYAAAQRLGLEEVPVIYAGNLSPDQARAYRLADNKVGESSEWDDSLLYAELDLLDTFDMKDFGFESSAEARRTASWKTNEKHCGLVRKVCLRSKCGYLYTSFYTTGKQGKTLEQIKADPVNVRPFADNLCDYILTNLGTLKNGGWCICTTPRRRHKEGFHFATEICRDAAVQLGIPFCDGAVSAKNRGRIETTFTLEHNPEAPNVILYDDIITTGITLRDTRRLLLDAGHNVLLIVAIRNQ